MCALFKAVPFRKRRTQPWKEAHSQRLKLGHKEPAREQVKAVGLAFKAGLFQHLALCMKALYRTETVEQNHAGGLKGCTAQSSDMFLQGKNKTWVRFSSLNLPSCESLG